MSIADSTIGYVLHAVMQQTHIQILYNESNPVLAQHVTVRFKDERVMDALKTILRGTELIPSIAQDGETIVIGVPPKSAPSNKDRNANGTISGRVTDSATNRGLVGATVRVDGTTLSVTTSDEGRFMLHDVPDGDQVLTVRLFGYKPARQLITMVDSQPGTVHVTMVSVPTVLSGVVTTATGQQRKIEVGNDITTLDVDSVMRVAPIQTVTDLLESRVPGLTVLHSSGTPGDPSRLRLRGAGSAQLNNDPIVVVDGIRVYASQSDARNATLAPGRGNNHNPGSYTAPSPLDQIDPSSIATIEVLKGPSATAIYGSDAASGVIVITTKHGRSGPTHWNLALMTGVTSLPGQWPDNYYRFGYNGNNAGPLCNWDDLSCRLDSVVAFQALNEPQYTVFSRGSSQQASLTASGGVSTLTYSLTGTTANDVGYLKLPGSEVQRYDSLYGMIPHSLVRPDRYSTWGVDGSLTAEPSTTLRVTLQSSLFSGTQQRSALDAAITQLSGEYVSSSARVGPFVPLGEGDVSLVPLLSREYERVTNNALTSNNAISMHWQPRTWLPLEATAGINTEQRNDVSYVPFGVIDGVYGGNTCSSDCDTTGSYGVGRGTSRVQTVNLGTAIPLFNQKATLAVGGNFYSVSTADFNVYTDQLAPGVTAPTSFLARCQDGTLGCNSPTSQSTSAQSTYGYYLEPRLNFASRFFVAPGFRFDGGSGGSRAPGSGLSGLSVFPKMDLSYVAVDRQGDRPLWGWLTQLRPRLAFGVGGTQPGPADKLQLFNVGSYNLQALGQGQGALTGSGQCFPGGTLDGVTPVTAVCLDALGNTRLRPERSREVEGGFDATLWRGRLSLTYTQYNKTRHDAIINIPVAPSVYSAGGGGEYGGVSPLDIQKNIGVIRNTGTEVQLNATILESRTLGWTVGGSFSNNTNLVMRLNQGQSPIVVSGGATETRVEAGYPLFGVFARPIVGYADANQDGVIERTEIRYGDSTVYVGQPDPKSQLTLTSDVTLMGGRLSVHTAFAYANGLTQFNNGACGSGAFQLLPNTPSTSLATQAAVVAASCNQNGGAVNSVTSPIGLVQVVNTFRFNTLSINYEVPASLSQLVRVPRMSVAIQGNNLGLHTNYRGVDPNVNAFSTGGNETQDTGQIPTPRTWLVNFKLGN